MGILCAMYVLRAERSARGSVGCDVVVIFAAWQRGSVFGWLSLIVLTRLTLLIFFTFAWGEKMAKFPRLCVLSRCSAPRPRLSFPRGTS
jgi:hypothetical protein